MPDVTSLTPADGALAERALAYLAEQDWCPPVRDAFLGWEQAGVAAFLVRLQAPIEEADAELWVVAGDLPCAYLVVDEAPDGATALLVYCDLMDDCAWTLLAGYPVDEAFPVALEPTPENAERLGEGVRALRKALPPPTL